MKEIITTITQRGQVTIPAEVRRKLGLRPRGKVAFRIDDGQVRLAPAEYTLESAYGSVIPQERPEDFKRISQEARNEHAQKVIEELGRR